MENEDLKTGMVLVTKDNKYAMVLKYTNSGDLVSGDLWTPITKNTNVVNELKVVKIYQPLNNKAFLAPAAGFAKRDIGPHNCLGGSPVVDRCFWLDSKDYKLIWEREDKKEMTIKEIEEELGYSIKIVKEDK